MRHPFFSRLQHFIAPLPALLNGPALPDALARLEAEARISLPASFKTLYGAYNGEKGQTGIFMGLCWLSAEEILTHWSELKLVATEMLESVTAYRPGTIQEQTFHPGWIPLAHDFGGNYIGLDFAPGPQGQAGQAIHFGRDEQVLHVLAPSLEALLALVLEQYELGRCAYLADGEPPYVAWDGDGHVLDDLERFLPGLGPIREESARFDAFWQQLEPSWREALRRQLGRDPANENDLARIRSLQLQRTDIVDLAPLRLLPSLRELVVSGLRIADWTPLSSAAELTGLFAARTPLASLAPLQPLAKLRRLYIGRTRISELSPLPSLPRLEELSLEELAVSDLAPLRDCAQLRALKAPRLRAPNIGEIGALSRLIALDLTEVPLADLRFLEQLKRLVDLRFTGAGDGDYTVLGQLPRLTSLTCPYDVFVRTKDLFGRKIGYTISGGMSEAEEQRYREYILHG